MQSINSTTLFQLILEGETNARAAHIDVYSRDTHGYIWFEEFSEIYLGGGDLGYGKCTWFILLQL